jgi:hypothetical protein
MTNCILTRNREHGRMTTLILVEGTSALKTNASFGAIVRLEVDNECLEQIGNAFKSHHANVSKILSPDSL